MKLQWRVMICAGLLALPFAVLADGGEVDGKKLYQALCTQCHGTQGDGKGINAAHMSVQPRSHIDTAEMSTRTDDDLYKVIEQGGKAINKSVLMPAWKDNLSEAQINALVKHLRDLCCSAD